MIHIKNNNTIVIYPIDCTSTIELESIKVNKATGVNIAYSHQMYNLGNERIYSLPQWYRDKLGLNTKQLYRYFDKLDVLDKMFHDRYVAMDIHLDLTDGIYLTSTPTDTFGGGKVGYIYFDKDRGRELFGNYYKSPSLSLFGKILSNLNDTNNKVNKARIWGYTISDQHGNILDKRDGLVGNNITETGIYHLVDYNYITKDQVLTAWDNK